MKRATRAALLALAAGLCLGVPSSAMAAADNANRSQYKVLVFTKAAGERHASTAVGAEAIEALGLDNRFVVQTTDRAQRFNDEDLSSYRVVVFLNTSGDVLDDAQQAAFERYFKAGGGFLGIHSAIETEPDWSFYSDILGTRAVSEAPLGTATIKVADRVHDASKSLPERWSRTDRFYNFASNVRGRFHVLATVDETTYAGGTMGADHPVAWCKDTQGGRAFYATTRSCSPPESGRPAAACATLLAAYTARCEHCRTGADGPNSFTWALRTSASNMCVPDPRAVSVGGVEPPVELRQLRYFVAVAEELHFGRAADRLHMSQSPLSRAIRELERDLGVVLFVRTTRHVELTAAGTALLEHGRRALAELDLAIEEARRAGGGQPGVVTIGHGPLSQRAAVRIADAAAAEHPELRFRLEEDVTPELLRRVASH